MLSRSEFVVDLVADAARAIELVGPTGGGRDAPRAIAKPSPSMKLVSVNVGLPRQAIWHGMRGTTDIFKEPILGSVPIHKLNLSGDVQAELTMHGGRYKAVTVIRLRTTTGGALNWRGYFWLPATSAKTQLC